MASLFIMDDGHVYTPWVGQEVNGLFGLLLSLEIEVLGSGHLLAIHEHFRVLFY